MYFKITIHSYLKFHYIERIYIFFRILSFLAGAFAPKYCANTKNSTKIYKFSILKFALAVNCNFLKLNVNYRILLMLTNII